MRKVLIDTNIYSAFKAGSDPIVEMFRHLDYIAIDCTVYAELLSGFKLGSMEKKNRKELEDFLNNPRTDLLNHNEDTAEFYAVIFTDLRKAGKPIPTNDIWIAATAMQHGLALLSLDKHFSDVPGLLLKLNS